MKKLLIFCVASILMSCEKPQPTIPGNTNEFKNEEARLRYLKEVEWPKAYREQDTLLLDRILGVDFQMITNDGEWSNKEKQLERIKAAPMNHDSFRYEIKRLELLENGTAIIAGTGHIINNGNEAIYQSSNILIKRNGIWKAVLSHVSGYKNLEASQ